MMLSITIADWFKCLLNQDYHAGFPQLACLAELLVRFHFRLVSASADFVFTALGPKPPIGDHMATSGF